MIFVIPLYSTKEKVHLPESADILLLPESILFEEAYCAYDLYYAGDLHVV